MISNYKRLGDYIQLVDERNVDLGVTILLGLTVNKKFIPSVANTIGTNMRNYKIIRKNQFACSLMQVRRDKKIPVALLKDFDEAIISQAYPIFEVIDVSVLNPDYLMMWFSRKEFDRLALFLAVGGVRGSLELEDFMNTELPIPSIEKQNVIVKEYNTVVNRIKLNEQLNQKLEETAQAIYKHWTVDFEFHNEQGKPYKSSGGKMVWNEELEKEIPDGWGVGLLRDFVRYNYSTYGKNDTFSTIEYLDTSSITNNKIDELQILEINQDTIPSRAKRKVMDGDIVYSTIRPNLKHFGIIRNPKDNMIVSTGFTVIQSKDIYSEIIYLHITSKETIEYFQSKAEMSVSTYPSIKPEDILNISISLPEKKGVLNKIGNYLRVIYQMQWQNNNNNNRLIKIKDLLLSKMTKV